MWFNVASIEYAPVILDTKVAILLLYRRVFLPHRGGIFDWILRVFIGVLVGFYLATTLVKIWECNPREKIWNTSIPGRCVNVSSLLNTSGLFNSITDVMILLVPVKFVWNLQLSRRQKVGVVAVFTIGFCGPAFSIIGFVVRLRISSSADVAYNYPEMLLWAAAEITTGLICVCIPELAAFGRYRHSSRPSESILTGAAVTRRNHPYSTMKRNSLDGQALCDGIRLEEGRSITSNIKREIPALPMGVVVVDIEGGVSLPQEMSGEKDVLGKGMVNSGGEDAGPKLGIMTSVRLEQTIT
ncbi:MAG: hypothetical protein LQ349_008498 [Xanthoria aureola]|nr:MAG: hypothetical protein LQ349_008498 [Xanthoria aureola]